MLTRFLFCTLFLAYSCLSTRLLAQQPGEPAAIVDEGKLIYRLEMASWFGTDIFMEKYKELQGNVGGYFSYANGDRTDCVFFSQGDSPEIFATISFDSSFENSRAVIAEDRKTFTTTEQDLFLLRKRALEKINSDTLFKTYKGTNLNLVPIIDGAIKKVYVLTGPQQNGVVIFGNDYLLLSDADNTITSVRQLHRNILPVEYGTSSGDKRAIAGMHTHQPETGDYITPTDIATLMLYQRLAGWDNYYVMSGKFVSIWNCRKNELTTMTRDAWDRIYAGDGKVKKSTRKKKSSS